MGLCLGDLNVLHSPAPLFKCYNHRHPQKCPKTQLALICPENCTLLPCLCQGLLCSDGWLAVPSSLPCVLTQLRAGVAVLSPMVIAPSALYFVMCQALGPMHRPAVSSGPCPAVLPLCSSFPCGLQGCPFPLCF